MSLLWLLVAVACLVPAAAALAALLGPRAGWILAPLLLTAAAAVGVLAADQGPSGATIASVPWLPTLDVGLALRLDGLGALFALVVLGIGAVVLFYSASYVTSGAVGFFTLMTGFAAAMLLLVVADDLIVMFVAWELTTLCSYLLVLRSGPDAVRPAARALVVTVLGGLCLLGAVVAIAAVTGTTRLSEALASPAWQERPAFATTVLVLIAVAAFTKAAQFPFHSWLPDAMVAPAPVSAYLHAAAMVKAGIFLLMRFAPVGEHSPAWGPLLIVVGLITAVMGAVFALQRSDLKELLAYSTVSQLGLIVAVIGIGTETALRAAALHVLAHALFKSSAFMFVGMLERRAGTRRLHELGDVARAMPWTTLAIVLAAASMAGAPPLLGFASKETMLEAALHPAASLPGWLPGWVLAGTIALGAVATAAYSARLVIGLFGGAPHRIAPAASCREMVAAVGLTAALGLALGPAIVLLEGIVDGAQLATVGGETEYLALWHGVNAPLLISVAVFGAAWALVVARARVDRLIEDRALLPFTGAEAIERMQTATIAGGRRVGDLTRRDDPASHLGIAATVIALAGLAVLVLPGGVGAAVDGLSVDTAVLPADLTLLVVVALGTLTLARARSRVAAVVAAGVVGFAVTLWFLVLGAVDVALTQLLVEVLTVVVLVLVLVRLPRTFRTTRRARRAATVAVASLAGVGATLATLALTGRRPPSAARDYYVNDTQAATGADNVVNSILVDFRALDTLGELVVLAVAALSVAALLRARPLRPLRPGGLRPATGRTLDDLADPALNAVFVQVLAKAAVPVMIFGSAFLLLRGHNAPGGGFIGALVGASAFTLAYLAAPTDDEGRSRLPALSIAGGGVVVAVATGFLGFVDGSFLRPLDGYVAGVHVTTALIFDVGVYLAVLGVILAALALIGAPRESEKEAAR